VPKIAGHFMLRLVPYMKSPCTELRGGDRSWCHAAPGRNGGRLRRGWSGGLCDKFCANTFETCGCR